MMHDHAPAGRRAHEHVGRDRGAARFGIVADGDMLDGALHGEPHGFDEHDFVEPEPATDRDILLVHDRAWVAKLKDGTLTYDEIVKLEIPYSRQTMDAIYHLPASAFHDIVRGNNGSPAAPGYDLVTGRGTPIANKLIAGLVGASSAAGASAAAG